MNLAQILAPNANSRIEADLAHQRRANIQARTRAAASNAHSARIRANAAAAKSAAERAAIQAQATRDAQVFSNLQGLGGTLTGVDLTGQDGRAALVGAMLGAGADINDPAVSAAYGTFLNPNYAPEQDMADVMLATGQVDSYGQTRPGQAQAENAGLVEALAVQKAADAGELERVNAQGGIDQLLAGINGQNNIDVAAANADAEMARLQFLAANPGARQNAGKPLTVSPTAAAKLREETEAILRAKFGNVDFPEETMAQINAAVASNFQQSRNAATAVQSALDALGVRAEQHEARIFPGNSKRLAVAEYEEGDTATGANGEKMIFRGGVWVNQP